MINKTVGKICEFITYNASVLRSQRKASLLERNRALKGSCKGRVFVCFTGTSVANFNISLLKGESVIGTNLFMLHPDYTNIDVEYYASIEPWCYEKFEFLRWLSEMVYYKSTCNTKLFLNASAEKYVVEDERDIIRKEDVYFVSGDDSAFRAKEINIELDQYCNVVGGSMFFGIALAMYLGFDEIYLLGADYSKRPVISGHFYDTTHAVSEGDSAVLAQCKKIGDFASSRGVKIVNIVDDGVESPVFDSILASELEAILSDT